jgi:hypothetical protein
MKRGAVDFLPKPFHDQDMLSRYLVERIAGLSNVEVLTQTQISGLEGRDGMLEAIRWRQGASAQEVRRPIQHPRTPMPGMVSTAGSSRASDAAS